MKKILALVTNLYYPAKGREYYREDILLSNLLRDHFRVILVHIEDLDAIRSSVDVIFIRNTGPMAEHEPLLRGLQIEKDRSIFNDLSGKGDIQGKRHLLDLFTAGYPVIPTIDSLKEIGKLGEPAEYLIKPINGCDSVGLQILAKREVEQLALKGFVIQPKINFFHEVSFYFIGKEFQYALYAPNPAMRWRLEQYFPNEEDIRFAKQFIDWNTCSRGIQRVDACRNEKGNLLLMELEDYNPFLSLELIDEPTKQKFIEKLTKDLLTFRGDRIS